MKKKRNILICQAGMAASYHLSFMAKRYFSDFADIYLCDTNPSYLVAASCFAKEFIQTSPFATKQHRVEMISLLREKKIDIFVPMMEGEMHIFPSDDAFLKKNGIVCVGVGKQVIALIQNKRTLSRFLSSHDLPVPKEILTTTIRKNTNEYFVKPVNGYGSKNSRKISFFEASVLVKNSNMLLQEVCSQPEITIECFNSTQLFSTICRERIETKGGVCTKARIFFDAELHALAKKICTVLPLPPALCIQVMKNQQNQWVITDINPRLGAGTSMVSTYGWSLAGALLAYLLKKDPLPWLKKRTSDVFVVRTYKDIIMKVR